MVMSTYIADQNGKKKIKTFSMQARKSEIAAG